MNTETYEKLLSELGISDWSPENRVAVLEEKYDDALNRLNVVQPSGDTEKINQLKERMKELGDAIDYTEKLQKSLSSGLVFGTQNEKDRLEELKEAGKEKAQTVRELSDVTQPISNSSTGQSATQQPVSASSSTQSKMRRAKMELEDGSWEKAEKLYEDILNEEPENAEANLGLFMASQQIRGKKQIPETARIVSKSNVDLFGDKQFLRAKRFADDTLKKELDDMVKGRDYLLAIEEMQRAKTGEDYKKVAGMFDKLGDFADAGTKKKEAEYHHAEAVLKRANDNAAFLAAKNLFESLGDYLDAKQKVQECERGIASLKDVAERRERQRQKEQEAYAKYKQEYDQFEEQAAQLKEIKECKAKIDSFEAAKKRLVSIKTEKVFEVTKRWFIIAGVLWLLCFAAPLVMERVTAADGYDAEDIRNELADYGDGIVGIVGATIEGVAAASSILLGPVLVISAVIAVIVCIFTGVNWFLCFIGTSLGIIIGIPGLAISGLFVFAHGYTKYAGIIGAVPFIAVLLLKVNAKRIKGAAAARTKKIEQLKKSILDEYANIERIAGSEYQKLFDRYADAGLNRKSVSEVQRVVRKKMGG